MTLLEHLIDLVKIRRDAFRHSDPAKSEKTDNPSAEYHRGFTEGLEFVIKTIQKSEEKINENVTSFKSVAKT